MSSRKKSSEEDGSARAGKQYKAQRGELIFQDQELLGPPQKNEAKTSQLSTWCKRTMLRFSVEFWNDSFQFEEISCFFFSFLEQRVFFVKADFFEKTNC